MLTKILLHIAMVVLWMGLLVGPVSAEEPQSGGGLETLTYEAMFPTDRVLDVQITIAQEDWDTIRKQSRNFFEALDASRKNGPIPGPYTYVPAEVKIDGHDLGRIGLRKKGFIGSQSESRPSLKIRLDEYIDDAHIAGMTNLTFNNNLQDNSQIHQFMGYRFFRDAGCPAPQCAYAHVHVNGESLGVYSHVETMRRAFCKRSFGSDAGTLYEGTVVDFVDGWSAAFEHKFGEDQLARQKIVDLIRALPREQLEGDWETLIGEHVDLDAFYRFWAVESLLGFWDGYAGNSNNFYIYLDPKDQKFDFLPWGLDAAFAKRSKIHHDSRAPVSVKCKGILAHKLYQTESGRKRIVDEILQLLQTQWDEDALIAETERIEAMLKPHLHASQSMKKSMWQVRRFIRNRREDIEEEIENELPDYTTVPDPPFVMPEGTATQMALLDAVYRGHIDRIRRYIDEKKDVDLAGPDGSTLLMMTALGGHIDIAKLLLDHGADINRQKKDGSTALHNAAFMVQSEMVTFLLENGADASVKNARGETAYDTVASDWSLVLAGIYKFVGGLLKTDLDLEHIRKTRPKVAEILKTHRDTTKEAASESESASEKESTSASEKESASEKDSETEEESGTETEPESDSQAEAASRPVPGSVSAIGSLHPFSAKHCERST